MPVKAQYDAALNTFVPPTPTSASFAKQVDLPTNTFTGSATITIPISTIHDNQLSHNITLLYNTSGIKGAEVSSSIGLGWQLGAGGVITRSIQSAPDERLFDDQLSGYFLDGVDPSHLNDPLYFEQASTGIRDWQSDTYFFNVNGYSGSFFFDQNNNVIQRQKSDLKITPILTTYAYNKLIWIITTPDGTKYYFGDTNHTDGVLDDVVSYSNQYIQPKDMVGAPARSNPLIDSWYLVRIESFDGSSVINFEYENFEAYSFRDVGTSVKMHILSDGMNLYNTSPGSFNDLNPVICTESLTPRLTKIISSDRQIIFEYDTNTRRDLDTEITPAYHPQYVVGISAAQITPPQALKSIQVYSINNIPLHYFLLEHDYFISSTNGFSGTLGLMQNTDQYGSFYTDMRRLKLDRLILKEGTKVESIYSFEYYNQNIQRRLTYAVDDHGFPNGKTNNITLVPALKIDTLAASMPLIDLTSYATLADRSPAPNETKKMMLKKINFPTGGSRMINYEGHDFYTHKVIETGTTIMDLKLPGCTHPFPPTTCTTCCLGQVVTSTAVQITPSPAKRYTLHITAIRTPNDMSNTPINVQIRRKIGSGSFIIFDDFALDVNNNFHIEKSYDQDLFAPFSEMYSFEIEAPNNRHQFLHLQLVEYQRLDTMVNQNVGGMRISSIIDNPIVSGPIETTYSYSSEENITKSSGFLAGLPTYIEKYPPGAALSIECLVHPNICIDVSYRLTSGNSFPLNTAQGSFIGYARVTERNSNTTGYIEYIHHVDSTFKSTYVRDFPSLPEYPHDDITGQLKSKRIYDSNGNIVSTEDHKYELYDYNPPSTSWLARPYSICCSNVNQAVSYVNPSRFVYKTQSHITHNNVLTIHNTQYIPSQLQIHTMPSSTSTINSLGEIQKETYTYIFDYPYNNDIKNDLINQNRINIPWKSEVEVDNIIVNGSRLHYAYAHPSDGQLVSPYISISSPYIYPALEERKEITWLDETVQDNGYQIYQTYTQYDLNSGKPTHFTRKGWPHNYQLTWTNTGKLSAHQYQNFNVNYTYDNTTNQIESITHIDNTLEIFEYDKFLRLKRLLLSPSNVQTQYSYHYPTVPSERAYIHTKINYPLTAGSDLDSVVHISYFDGIGNNIQKIHKYGAPIATYDIISNIDYDVHGRPTRHFEAIEVPNNHGLWYNGPFNGGYTETLYHDDPLDRIAYTTPPDWYSTAYSYGTNNTALTHPEGHTYPPHSLIRTSLTDPDNKITDIYKDKLGNIILNRIREGTHISDTWTLYDPKHRPVKVYPPGTSLNTPDLIFTYAYDGKDNIIHKKMPDAAPILYRYSERNLMTAMQNNILALQNKWLVVHYDEYGRPIKRGYYIGTDPGTTETPLIDEVLEEYHYDGYNGQTQTSDPIYKGRLKKSRLKTLNDGGQGGQWIEKEYFYDSYGRVMTESITNHLGDTESKMYSYDFGDNLLTLVHNISGVEGINHATSFTYDHQGRKHFTRTNINGTGEKTLSEWRYNHKNQIIERNLGRFATTGTHQYLQSLDYSYNTQGWLTGINTLFPDLLPTIDPCNVGSASGWNSGGSTTITTDGEDIFALELKYDSALTGSGVPYHRNGNITAQTWWHKGQYNQSYSYTYDYLNRITQGRHGQVVQGNHTLLHQYDENFSYDARGNISTLDRKGMVQQSHIAEQCYTPITIDSLSYIYQNGTNKLIQVIDNAPCRDTITLPRMVDRDMHYAAGQLIRITNTDILCDLTLHLTAGTEIKILDTLHLPNNCGAPSLVISYQGPCPQDKYTEGFNQQSLSGQYTYDADGNMTYDPNKKLTFYYNHLNLPYLIEGHHNDTLHMVYTPTGTLVQRTYIKNGQEIDKIDYLDNKERINGVLTHIHTSEGRVIKNNTTYTYEYHIKDHLGNIRVAFADVNNDGLISATERQGRYDYYAFGHQLEGPWSLSDTLTPSQRYRYNGKELVKDMNIHHLLYGARNYDPVLGRFISVDPLADQRSWLTPYNYVQNNPLNRIDPTGMLDTIPNSGQGGFVAMGPEVTVTASRTGLHDQTAERYGFNGTLEQWQERYGCQGCSYENTQGFWSAGDNGAFDNYVASQDQAEAARVAVEKMSFWMGKVFPTIATVISPSGGIGNGGVIGPGLKLRNFNFSSPISSTIKPVHGNSLSSQRSTWFYKLYSNDGTFLKNGITSAIRPELRYTRSFMADKYMSNTRLFPNRRSAYDFEFQQNIILRGPLNKNMH